jgi:imidazolonepropionase-like amidohydrolase
MRSARTVCVLALLGLGVGRAAVQPQTSGACLFEGARLIAGDGSSPLENSAFVVENGRFTQVGKRGELRPPPGVTRINLTGKTVIPGLIDAHAHLGMQRYRDWTSRPENYTRENILDQLNRASFFGLSAIYSAGSDSGDFWYTLRDEISAGRHPTAARWVPAGPGMTSSAQSREPARHGTYGVDTAAEARKAVQELAGRGVKVPKFFVEGRPGRGGLEPLRPAVYEALIDEAHKHGMRTFVHAHDVEDGKRLLRAGNDGFAHKLDWPKPDAELLSMLKARGPKVFMTPTQPSPPGAEAARLANPDPLLRQTILPMFLKRLQDNVVPKTLTAAEREDANKTWDDTYWLRPTWPSGSAEYDQAKKAWDNVRDVTQKFLATGIRIGVGSDTSGFLPDRLVGWALHVEMEEMVQSGMTPAQVIVAGTKTNAEWLGLDDLGAIHAGKTATFVVLDADPLVDIKNTRKIHSVYVGGAELDRTALAAAWANPGGGLP